MCRTVDTIQIHPKRRNTDKESKEMSTERDAAEWTAEERLPAPVSFPSHNPGGGGAVELRDRKRASQKVWNTSLTVGEINPLCHLHRWIQFKEPDKTKQIQVHHADQPAHSDLQQASCIRQTELE